MKYDFKCPVCDRVAETDKYDEPVYCMHPEEGDGMVRMKRVYGSVAISFKGSGFYRNDSKV